MMSSGTKRQRLGQACFVRSNFFAEIYACERARVSGSWSITNKVLADYTSCNQFPTSVKRIENKRLSVFKTRLIFLFSVEIIRSISQNVLVTSGRSLDNEAYHVSL